MKIRNDFSVLAYVPFESTAWVPSPEPKVERKMLERDGAEVARATSLVRYAKGSSFAEHTHELGEEFVVLEGVFSDEHGDFPKGTYVRNPPGSKHRPFSVEGCTIFVKLRQVDRSDLRRVVIRLEDRLRAHEGPISTTLLHSFGSERVSLFRLAPGATLELGGEDRGAEIFVLSGSLDADGVHCGAWSWLRAPRASARLQSSTGCVFWLKQGHLPRAAEPARSHPELA